MVVGANLATSGPVLVFVIITFNILVTYLCVIPRILLRRFRPGRTQVLNLIRFRIQTVNTPDFLLEVPKENELFVPPL